MLATDEIKAILKPQFGFLGKGGEFKAETLWVHAFTLWSIASRIIKFIPRFDDRERRLLEITVLIHDIGKMTKKNQAVLTGQAEGRVKHTQTKEQIKEYFEDNALIEQIGLSEADIDFIYHAHLHHSLPEEALKTAPPSFAVYADIVRYADWLASMERLDRRQVQQISSSLEPFCQITTVHISRPEGPSNYLLFDTAFNIYKEMGWDALLVLRDSLLLIAPKGMKYPEKKEVVQKFQDQIIRESLRLQSPTKIKKFTSKLLGGESKKNPRLYFEVHKEIVINLLDNFDTAEFYFLKFLIELFENTSSISQKIKGKYVYLNILKGLSGTNNKKAKEIWQGIKPGLSIEPKDIRKEIYQAASLSELIPQEVFDLPNADRKIKPLKGSELFEFLCLVAEKLYPSDYHYQLQVQEKLELLISMEEEVDFREITLERFAKYKDYKKDMNPEKGICETCGFALTFAAQESLGFPDAHGFSQIRAKTDGLKATCMFCTYDTLKNRGGIPKDQKPIYIRLESKNRDIWQLYGEIRELIQKLNSAFSNPYTLENLNRSVDYGFLPLPTQFKLPKLIKLKNIYSVFKTVRGYLISIDRVDMKTSPKDLRSRHLCLYALLKMMGFDTHIGFEEQNGLFGDNPITRHGEDYESLYYRGLAIKYLANLLGGEKKEKQNAHVLAESILTKSPSTAVTKIREAAEDKKRRNKLTGEQLRYIIEAIIKGHFTLKRIKNGGEYTMKDLLKNAAFFADKENGIGHFCVEPEKRGDFWNPRNMTRHNTAKPVSDALDEIMQGREMDMAMERFMRNLAKKIGQDEQDKLADFIKGTKDILKKYHELRKLDISEFIKAKNALTSAIYLLTRYEKLNIKEVVNE